MKGIRKHVSPLSLLPPPYPPSENKWRTIAIAFCIGMLICLFLLILSYDRYTDLNDRYLLLNSEYQDLRTYYDSLRARYEALQNSYNSLERNYSILLAKHQVLEAMRIGHFLENYYEEVRKISEPEWFTRDHRKRAEFAANLAKHNLGRFSWPSLEQKYYELAKEHSYDTASRKLDEVYNLIGISPADSSVEKIRKILSFVNAYVHYENDYNDAFLAPVETLAFMSGDCEDYSMLVAALFEKAGIDSAIGIFTNGTDSHVMVLVHLDTISPYRFWYYSDLRGMGLSTGNWIIIEPQRTIENQYDPGWFKQWEIQAAAEV